MPKPSRAGKAPKKGYTKAGMKARSGKMAPKPSPAGQAATASILLPRKLIPNMRMLSVPEVMPSVLWETTKGQLPTVTRP